MLCCHTGFNKSWFLWPRGGRWGRREVGGGVKEGELPKSDKGDSWNTMQNGGGAWLSQWAGQCFVAMQVSTWAGPPDFVFVTLFRTAVERASYGVHKLLRTGEVPTTLTSIVLVLADGLFGLCRSERLGQAIHRYHWDTPPPPLPRPLTQVKPPTPPHPHPQKKKKKGKTVAQSEIRDQELCESRGGRSGFPVPIIILMVSGRKAGIELKLVKQSSGGV